MGIVISYIIYTLGIITLFLGISLYKNNKGKKELFLLLSSISSFIWSVGFGFLIIQTDPETAWLCRTIGMVGVFPYILFGAENVFEIKTLNRIERKIVISIIAVSFILFPFVTSKSLQTFSMTKFGMGYTFVDNICFDLYNALFIFVLVYMAIYTIRLFKHATFKREKHMYKLLIGYIVIQFIGSVLDTVMPALGYPSFPGSTLAQPIGVIFFYFMWLYDQKNRVSINNIADYIYHYINFPILIFDHNKELKMLGDSAVRFLNTPGIDLKIEDIFACDSTIFERPEADENKQYLCKMNNRMCILSIEKKKDKYGDIIGYVVAITDMTEKNKISQLNQTNM